MNNLEISIITPTYNRRELIERAYKSLTKQINLSFEWIVIDDGSTDNTKDFFSRLDEKRFEIIYIYKENGGKHTALNLAHRYIRGDIVIILDSDDYLTEDAVDTIIADWQRYIDDKSICCISYCRIKTDGGYISNTGLTKPVVSNHIEYRINANRGADRCETVRAEYFMAYPFPVFPGEKFMSEGWLWNNLAYKYRTVYIDKGIYVGEYLEQGLTKSGRRFRMTSPNGMMLNCKSFFDKRFSLSVRIKEYLLYWVYGKCAHLGSREIIIKSGHCVWAAITMPYGLLLYKQWEKRYLTN